MTLLRAQGVEVAYGPVVAVAGLDLTAYRGEVLALIGPNGAGKSTVLDAIAGTVRPAAGSVLLDGMELTGLRPAARRRAGIGRVFQTPRLAGPTPLDDVVLAATGPRGLVGGLLRRPSAPDRERAAAALTEAGVGEDRWHQPVGRLGLPDQRRVELARALAADPCLLLLDEPASGLPSAERDAFADLIVALAGPERGVVLVEHDMGLVGRCAHHVVALDRGRVVTDGPYAAVAAHPDVRTSYLGDGPASASASRPRRRRLRAPAGPAVLEVSDLRARYGSLEVLRGVDLAVAAGEVVSLLGPNGAGKSTLARAVLGLHGEIDGAVRVDGSALPAGDPRRRARAGLVGVGDGRDLVGALTVDRYLRLVLDDDGVDHAHDLFPRLAELTGRRCAALSGGEAQLVALARALGSRPRALVVDELSQGLAPVALQALLPSVRAAADAGCAVLLVEQFTAAATAVADRVVMLEAGEIRYDGPVDGAPLAGGYLRPEDAHPPQPTAVRTDVTIGMLPSQRRMLARLAATTGLPAGQLVRDAVNRFLAQSGDPSSSGRDGTRRAARRSAPGNGVR